MVYKRDTHSGDILDSCKTIYKVEAPAKLNLGLRIIGRRHDGYHLLQSLFWPISISDLITIERLNRQDVFCEMSWDIPEITTPLPCGPANVAYRAAQVAQKYGAPGTKIEIRKRIPIGGGLGGGSSNAGTILRSLVPKIQSGLIDDASRLGADVPFFLNPTPSWVEGVGEELTQIRWLDGAPPQLYFTLIFPPQGNSTPQVFARFKKSGHFSPHSELKPELSSQDLFDHLASASNDLESAASELNPQMFNVILALRKLGASYAGMSGSGSTCFAVFRNFEEREENRKAVQEICRDYHCRTLNAETYISTIGEQHGNHRSEGFPSKRG